MIRIVQTQKLVTCPLVKIHVNRTMCAPKMHNVSQKHIDRSVLVSKDIRVILLYSVYARRDVRICEYIFLSTRKFSDIRKLKVKSVVKNCYNLLVKFSSR